MKVASCTEHLELAIEWFVDEAQSAPDVERIADVSDAECSQRSEGNVTHGDEATVCFYCGKPAEMLLVSAAAADGA